VSHEQLIDKSAMYRSLALHTIQFLRNTKIVQRDLHRIL